MRYEGIIYRPPSEANSLLIQATVGCPHNRCAFCAMYRDKAFRIRPVAEIKEDILQSRRYYGDEIETVFFPDGNTIIMRTEQLEEIFRYTREVFPAVKRITVYGSARFINMKTADELQRLKAAGLSRIHSGMESGDDVTLTRIAKGADAAAIVEAGKKVRDAGIELSEYVLIGVGGRERSAEHALASAVVLNRIVPEFIRLRTYIPMPGTPLYDQWRSGMFGLLSPHEALRETRSFIAALAAPGSMLYSDHPSNYAYINGRIPEDKPLMLATIDRLLTLPEHSFRPPETGSL
ncbi:MAG: radical SAM protein [Negativicutes bacterium]|nr:radical SAM protein [Negativicutes bacterium]